MRSAALLVLLAAAACCAAAAPAPTTKAAATPLHALHRLHFSVARAPDGGPFQTSKIGESLEHRDALELRLHAPDRELHLLLRRNERLFAPGMAVHFGSKHDPNFVVEHCYYAGEVVGEPGAYAALSTCGGGLEGSVHTATGTYVVTPAAHFGHATLGAVHGVAARGAPSASFSDGLAHASDAGAAAGAHVVFNLADAVEGGSLDQTLTCGHAEHEAASDRVAARVAAAAGRAEAEGADAREAAVDAAIDAVLPGAGAGGAGSGARRRLLANGQYDVELLLVVDYRVHELAGHQSTAAAHAFEVANLVSVLFQRLPEETVGTVAVTLTAVDVWTSETNVLVNGALPVTGYNMEDYLTAFLQWAQVQRSSDTLGHDHAIILVGRKAASGVGRALTSGICGSLSGAIAEDRTYQDGSLAFTAITCAHELGHSVGSGHDGVGDSCEPRGGLMAESIGFTRVVSDALTWSECSASDIRGKLQALDAEPSSCLDDSPRHVLGTAVHCGDFVVDDGEECDYKLTPGLCNEDCTFKENVQCTSGECCTASGVFKAAGALCDNALGSCDLPDRCNGTSSQCPTQEYLPDGTPCETVDFPGSFCAEGVCVGYSQQCLAYAAEYYPSGGRVYAAEPCLEENKANVCGNLECNNVENDEVNCVVLIGHDTRAVTMASGTPCRDTFTPGCRNDDDDCVCDGVECVPRPNATACPACSPEHGTCAHSGRCVCDAGWTGTLCDEEQQCFVNCSQLNRAECVPGVSSACGECLPGFDPSLLDGDEVNTPCLFEVPDLDNEIVDSNTFPGFNKEHAFDRDVNTRWVGQMPLGNSTTLGPDEWPWLGVHYSEAFEMVHYKLVSAALEAAADPATWIVYGALARGEEWIEIDRRTRFLFAARLQEEGFTVARPGMYASYKFEVREVAGSSTTDFVQVAELGFYEKVSEGSHDPEAASGGGGGNGGLIAAAVLIPLLLIGAALAGGWYYYRKRKAEDAAASWRWRPASATPATAAGGAIAGGLAAGASDEDALDAPTLFVAQPAPAASSLPVGWSEHVTDDGNVYYFNESTGESVWERPM